MTFRRVDELKMGLVAYLKSKTTITSLLYNDDPEQIKEAQWQGTEADYPNVRVRIISLKPVENCSITNFTAGILVFDEEASSANADYIAGIIGSTLHSRSFRSSGIAFSVNLTDLVPAIRQDMRTWRSEVLINGLAS